MPPPAYAPCGKVWGPTSTMDAEHHDLVLAVTSHTPHLIAYTMVGVADDLRRVTDSEVIKYWPPVFAISRDRGADPTMWRDVFLTTKRRRWKSLAFHRGTFALQRAISTGWRASVRLFHPHACHPSRHHRGRSGHRGPRFRTQRYQEMKRLASYLALMLMGQAVSAESITTALIPKPRPQTAVVEPPLALFVPVFGPMADTVRRVRARNRLSQSRPAGSDIHIEQCLFGRGRPTSAGPPDPSRLRLRARAGSVWRR